MESRSGKQCRERYINQLDPRIKKTMWTFEEDAIIMRLHSQYGKKWSRFMDQLPGRSDNAIKNRYHIISRDNYSDHYQQHSQQNQNQKRHSEEDDGSDDQSESSAETDEALLQSLQAKRKMLDQQIETLVQKRKRLRTVSCDDDHSSDSFHESLQVSNDIPGLDSPHKSISDAVEHLSALRKSAHLQNVDLLGSQLKTAFMKEQEPATKDWVKPEPTTPPPVTESVVVLKPEQVVSDVYTLL